jgi:hypothetical protein
MTRDALAIGCAAGFGGDRTDAAGLVLEMLAERTLALVQLGRRADPERGYAPLMVPMLRPILRGKRDIHLFRSCRAEKMDVSFPSPTSEPTVKRTSKRRNRWPGTERKGDIHHSKIMNISFFPSHLFSFHASFPLPGSVLQWEARGTTMGIAGEHQVPPLAAGDKLTRAESLKPIGKSRIPTPPPLLLQRGGRDVYVTPCSI